MTNHAVVEGFIPIRKCWELLFPDNSLCFRSFQQLQLDNYEWYPMPHNLIRKNARGCPICANNSFKRKESGFLYYLYIFVLATGQELFKLGISGDVESRIKELENPDVLIKVIWKLRYSEGFKAIFSERQIKGDPHFKKHLYKGSDVLTSGNTELYTTDITQLDFSGHRLLLA